MNIRLEQIHDGKDEIVIRYHEMTDEIEKIVQYLDRSKNAIVCKKDNKQIILVPGDILYFESVDGVTYAYTKEDVYSSPMTLAVIEQEYEDMGYFRCSKSMIINIYQIGRLQSKPGNRIDAQMNNGEHVIISRHYAKDLRNILKGGMR